MKAQVISTDLMVAVLIILIIISAIGVLLIDYLGFDQQSSENRDLGLKGQEAMAVLTGGCGSPCNWDES
jgi:hypothetical protein